MRFFLYTIYIFTRSYTLWIYIICMHCIQYIIIYRYIHCIYLSITIYCIKRYTRRKLPVVLSILHAISVCFFYFPLFCFTKYVLVFLFLFLCIREKSARKPSNLILYIITWVVTRKSAINRICKQRHQPNSWIHAMHTSNCLHKFHWYLVYCGISAGRLYMSQFLRAAYYQYSLQTLLRVVCVS